MHSFSAVWIAAAIATVSLGSSFVQATSYSDFCETSGRLSAYVYGCFHSHDGPPAPVNNPDYHVYAKDSDPKSFALVFNDPKVQNPAELRFKDHVLKVAPNSQGCINYAVVPSKLGIWCPGQVTAEI